MTKPLATLLLAAGLSASAAAPCLAETGHVTRIAISSTSVRTADLDLSTPAGERQLRARVAQAVRQVCRLNDVETGYRSMTRDARACAAKARASADRQIAALLTEEQRGG